MGSSFSVHGDVTLDTGKAVQGAKAVGSEIEKLSKTGIAGFEAAQQKVIDLTKRMGELRNQILATNDPAAQTKLNAALSQTQTQLRAAKTEFRGMTLETREANEKAQLLAGSLGIQLPAGMQNLISKMPGVQAALGAAFNASIVFAVGAAIVALFPKIADWIDQLRGVKDVNEELLSRQLDLNRLLATGGKPNTFKALTDEMTNVSAKLNEARNKVDAFNKSVEEAAKFQGFMGAPNLGMTIRLKPDDLKSAEQDIVRLTKRYEELQLAIPKAQLEEEADAHKKAAEEAKKHAEALKTLREQAAGAQLSILANQMDAYNRLLDASFEAEAAANKTLTDDLHKQRAEQLKDQEDLYRQTAIISGRRWDQEKKSIDSVQDAVKKAAKEQQEIYERTASSIEHFIDRVFLTAKSLSDVFHQFLTQLLGSFVKFVSRSIAEALLGMKQVSGGGAGGSGLGGILGSIFGGIFGGGGSTAVAGGTPALQGAGGGSSFGGIAALPLGSLGSVMSASGGGIPKAAGGATSGIFGKLAFGGADDKALIKSLLVAGALLGATGGAMLTGSAFKSGSILGGAAGGALTGASIGLLLGGPIGAAIGAVFGAEIGALLGWLGRGRAKRKAAAIQDQLYEEAQTVFKEYERAKLDYSTALESMDALRDLGYQQTKPLGKPGRNAFDYISGYLDNFKRQIDAIEEQRQGLSGRIGSMSLPEFALGGKVPSAGGGILALVHPGEFVMRKSAVDTLGTEFLGALNRAPRFADGGPVSVSPLQSAGSSRALSFGPNYFYQQPGESSQALARRVAAAIDERMASRITVMGLRRASLDGAI